MDSRKKILLIVVGLIVGVGVIVGKMTQQSLNQKSAKTKVTDSHSSKNEDVVKDKKSEPVVVAPSYEPPPVYEKYHKEEEEQESKYKEISLSRKGLYFEKLSPENQELIKEKDKEVKKLSDDFLKKKHKEIQERMGIISKNAKH